MAWRMVKQPNGKYARWSDIVDSFTHLNLAQHQALDLCIAEAGMAQGTEKMKRAERDLMETHTGTGLERWAECLKCMRDLGKWAQADEAEKYDKEGA